ncbi:MAG: histidine phosphatase family protein [Candidatus Acidiferrum sp.]
MELYIVRHGIAVDREDPKCPADPERFLTNEGIEKTQQVAKGVAAVATVPDLMLSSPYLRAVQTAEIFAALLEYPKLKIRKSDLLLPGAEPLQLFRELSKDKELSTVFVFGHAPHLDDLIATALGAKHHISSLKKAGVALVELKRLVPPSGELLWLATPKLLRKAGK